MVVFSTLVLIAESIDARFLKALRVLRAIKPLRCVCCVCSACCACCGPSSRSGQCAARAAHHQAAQACVFAPAAVHLCGAYSCCAVGALGLYSVRVWALLGYALLLGAIPMRPVGSVDAKALNE